MGVEAAIERWTCTYARSRGFKALKLNGTGDAGKPDRLFIGPGRKIGFAEFKAPGEKPRKLQLHWRELIIGFDFKHAFIYSIAQGKAFVDAL